MPTTNDLADPTERCTRCGGTGYLPQFKHVASGECFECGGLGLVPPGHVYRDSGMGGTQGTPGPALPCRVIEVQGHRAEVTAWGGDTYRVDLGTQGFLAIDKAAAKAGRIELARDADGEEIYTMGIQYGPGGVAGAVRDLEQALTTRRTA